MTKDEILAMKPGYELNALIAKRVFKKEFFKAPMLEWHERYVYKHFRDDPNSHYGEWHRTQRIGEWEYCGPKYSTDISEAWEVINHMFSQGWGYCVNSITDHRFPEGIEHCNFSKPQSHIPNEDVPYIDQGQKVYRRAHAQTISEAICKAALIAMAYGTEEPYIV